MGNLNSYLLLNKVTHFTYKLITITDSNIWFWTKYTLNVNRKQNARLVDKKAISKFLQYTQNPLDKM